MRFPERSRGRLWPEIVGALVVAVVFAFATLLAMGIVGPSRSEEDPAANLAGTGNAISLDVGTVDDRAVAACLVDDFADEPDEVDVSYAVEQRTATGSVPVLVLRNGLGHVLLCDAFGPTRPATVPQPVATPARPAVLFTSDSRQWDCTGDRLRSFTMSTWLSVTEPVTRGQLRFVVDGEPGPWFTSAARNGFVHLQAWLSDLPRDAEVAVQLRTLDADGEPVASSGLPGKPTQVGSCPGRRTAIG